MGKRKACEDAGLSQAPAGPSAIAAAAPAPKKQAGSAAGTAAGPDQCPNAHSSDTADSSTGEGALLRHEGCFSVVCVVQQEARFRAARQV